MMLSKRITENRRLDTAAPAIRHRMITRSRPRVFRPLTCFMNWSDSSAAILGELVVGERETLHFWAASRSSSY